MFRAEHGVTIQMMIMLKQARCLLLLVSCLAYSSTLKIGAIYFSEASIYLKLYGVTSHNTAIFMFSVVRTLILRLKCIFSQHKYSFSSYTQTL
jgi:hypothetical protein